MAKGKKSTTISGALKKLSDAWPSTVPETFKAKTILRYHITPIVHGNKVIQ